MKTKISKPITYEELHKVLHYCPTTGKFTWAEYRGPSTKVGAIAGNKSPSGYMDIKLGGASYRQHRLAWLYVTGSWPKGEIDHIDRDKTNNVFSNLRDVTASENVLNAPIRIDNTSGFKGVSKVGEAWISQVYYNKQKYYLGSFKTAEEANKTRLIKLEELGVLS